MIRVISNFLFYLEKKFQMLIFAIYIHNKFEEEEEEEGRRLWDDVNCPRYFSKRERKVRD